VNEAERQFQNQLQEQLQLAQDDEITDLTTGVINTFEEAGMLTLNAGLIVRTPDGAQFQLTIVQSERAR